MTVQLNHTIIRSHDKQASAEFLSRILGLAPPTPASHFAMVEVGNGVSLDYDDYDEVQPQHYAFLVSDSEFEPILDRVRAEGVAYYADPAHMRPGVINVRERGRNFYFDDPDGHNLEVLTRPALESA